MWDDENRAPESDRALKSIKMVFDCAKSIPFLWLNYFFGEIRMMLDGSRSNGDYCAYKKAVRFMRWRGRAPRHVNRHFSW